MDTPVNKLRTISPKALELLRLVFPHHKDITGDKECDSSCYRCEIEKYVESVRGGLTNVS